MNLKVGDIVLMRKDSSGSMCYNGRIFKVIGILEKGVVANSLCGSVKNYPLVKKDVFMKVSPALKILYGIKDLGK